MPPLRGPNDEAATDRLLAAIASPARWSTRSAPCATGASTGTAGTCSPPPSSRASCCSSEAMIGVAVTGERKWHASWWEWHGLIITAYVIIGIAVRREWRDERFRHLYLPSTRERRQEISVLFGDLVGFTRFAERSSPGEVAAVLNAYWGIAAPLDHPAIRRRGREVHRRRHARGLQQTRRPARSCGARRRARRSSCSGAGGACAAPPRLAADARRHQQRRGGRAGDRWRRARRVSARRRHGQHRLTTRAARAGRRRPDRRVDLPAAADRGGRRPQGGPAGQGQDDPVDAYLLLALP